MKYIKLQNSGLLDARLIPLMGGTTKRSDDTKIGQFGTGLKQSLAILETCGYFISPELNFIYGIFGDKTTLAKVNLDKKEILVSEQLIDKPLFDIISMIIEENEHFRTGHTDCSRQFQQHFIDLYTKTLLDKNEALI